MSITYSNKYILETGIGLQEVDHLKNSSYFNQESNRYINGEISLDELDQIITSYYQSLPIVENRTEEADKISIRIGQLISEDSFTFSVGQFISIHSFLFKGILKRAGQLRTFNISKKEWVLDGATVMYGDYRELAATLEYDFNVEKNYKYAGKSIDEIIKHLAVFISNLWQIHAFEEGNTRTTAVFTIKYLRSLGFDVNNDTFAKNAWYFRNALVRANYNNLTKGVAEDRTYIELFLRNLLLGENNILQNRQLHIASTTEQANVSRESRIISLMMDNPSITLEEIATNLSVSLRTVKSVVASLKESGKIVRTAGRKNGKWEVL